MEVFKEVSMFGFSFFKARKGININEAEIKEIKDFCNSLGKKVDKTADFINKNQLVEPISAGLLETLKIICIIFFLILVLAVIFSLIIKSLFACFLTILLVATLCRIVMIVSAVVMVILLFLIYTQARGK